MTPASRVAGMVIETLPRWVWSAEAGIKCILWNILIRIDYTVTLIMQYERDLWTFKPIGVEPTSELLYIFN